MTNTQPAIARIETSIIIHAPIDLVWNILVDYERYNLWNSYIIQVDGAAQANCIINVHSIMGTGLAPVIAPVTVISVDPYAMHWEGGLPDRTAFKGDHVFALTAVDAKTTQMSHHEDFTGTKAAAILDQYHDTITANFHLFNADLKKHAETLRSASPSKV